MRLDHLLSKERKRLKVYKESDRPRDGPERGGGAVSSELTMWLCRCSKGHLQEESKGLERTRPWRMSWGCSSAGRAPALQAGGQEFDPPHLHHTALRGVVRVTSEQTKKHGRIAQVVRAHA